MPPLAEAAPEMRDQHLTDGGFIADQLHQLIDAILFKQIFGTLLLQGEAGIEKGQPRAFSAASLRLPGQPAAGLHHIEQGAHVAARAAQHFRQLVEGGLLRLAVAALP